jgi:hypothetical protein
MGEKRSNGVKKVIDPKRIFGEGEEEGGGENAHYREIFR